MTSLFETIANAIRPERDVEIERDGLNVSLFFKAGSKQIEIDRHDLIDWLDAEGYLLGCDETHYQEAGEIKSRQSCWNIGAEEFIDHHLTDEILKDYLRFKQVI